MQVWKDLEELHKKQNAEVVKEYSIFNGQIFKLIDVNQ